MKNTAMIGMLLGALLAGCESRGNASPNGRGGGPQEAAEGADRAVRAAGHGIVYGVRELGQTLSGTQGNPQAEAQSQEQRRLMEQRAHEADQHMDNAADRARERIHESTAPRDESHPADHSLPPPGGR